MAYIPKVRFLLPTIKREAYFLHNFCRPRPTGWDWSDRVYKQHPELKEMVNGIKNEDEFFKLSYKYARKFIKEHKDELEKVKREFQKDWDKVGDKFLRILSSHFETDWPRNKKIIMAFISINPICPRFLDKWSFSVRYKRPEYLKKIVCHEIIHFLYFKKWKEVFPKATRKSFDSPHIIWKLSEILAPIILNYHPEIQKIVKIYSPGYKEFQDIKIGNKKLIPYFEDLYKKHLKNNQSFEDFLRLAWENIEKHKDIINKI